MAVSPIVNVAAGSSYCKVGVLIITGLSGVPAMPCELAEFGVTASRTIASMHIRQTPNLENLSIACPTVRIRNLSLSQ